MLYKEVTYLNHPKFNLLELVLWGIDLCSLPYYFISVYVGAGAFIKSFSNLDTAKEDIKRLASISSEEDLLRLGYEIE